MSKKVRVKAILISLILIIIMNLVLSVAMWQFFQIIRPGRYTRQEPDTEAGYRRAVARYERDLNLHSNSVYLLAYGGAAIIFYLSSMALKGKIKTVDVAISGALMTVGVHFFENTVKRIDAIRFLKLPFYYWIYVIELLAIATIGAVIVLWAVKRPQGKRFYKDPVFWAFFALVIAMPIILRAGVSKKMPEIIRAEGKNLSNIGTWLPIWLFNRRDLNMRKLIFLGCSYMLTSGKIKLYEIAGLFGVFVLTLRFSPWGPISAYQVFLYKPRFFLVGLAFMLIEITIMLKRNKQSLCVEPIPPDIVEN